MDNTNDITNMVSAITQVVTDSNITSAFNQGLLLGAVICGTLLAFSLLRTGLDEGHEEL